MSFPDFSANDWFDGMQKLGVQFVQSARARLKPGDEAASAFEAWQRPFEFAIASKNPLPDTAAAQLERLFQELQPHLYDSE